MRILLVLLLIFCPKFAAKVHAIGTVVIVELQTGGVADASSEFVRIANLGAGDLDITGWMIKTTPATGNPLTSGDQTKRATLIGTLAAGANLLIATNNFVTSEVHQAMTSPGMSADGHVELVDKTGVVQDVVGWGSAAHPEGASAPKPASGQSLLRIIDGSGKYVDTDNNLADFELGGSVVVVPPGSPPVPSPGGSGSGLAMPIITELLPNPAAPQTDDKDEYVELFNPSSVGFPLNGFKLQTGATFSYSFTFTNEILPAQGYAIFTSGTTPLTLSNTSGAARLLDSSGAVVSLTDSYATASEGQSWALINGVWVWTATVTPAAENILSSPSSAAAVKPATTKTTAKTTKPKAVAVKAAKTTKSSTTSTGNDSGGGSDTKPPSRLHPLILAGVGGLAVVYGVYEYRHDIQNAFYKLRRYRTNRRETRGAP